MTTCQVTCYACGTNTLPRVWRHLCVDCARQQIRTHQTDTGHRADLHIAEETTLEDIRRDIERASRLMGRPG